MASDPLVLRRVAAVLSKKPGHAFCDDCLAEAVGLDRDVVWEAAGELSPSPDYEVDAGICSVCFTHVEHVAHVQWVTPSTDAIPDPEPAESRKHLIRFRFSA